MATLNAVKIEYWKLTNHDFIGIEEFRKELSDNYVSVVHSRLGGRGGGLFELAINYITDVSLPYVLASIGSGITYDLIKSGSNSFLLRPLITAYNKLAHKNHNSDIGIDNIRIDFSDSILIIDWIGGDISDILGKIFSYLEKHYQYLKLDSGEYPFEIHIPVLEEILETRENKYRYVFNEEASINKLDQSIYFKFWGLYYDTCCWKVYDVKNKKLYNETPYTEEMYRERNYYIDFNNG